MGNMPIDHSLKP